MADDYRVTNQRQTTQLNGGQFQPVMEVTFQMTDGTTGAVTIPLATYSADTVKAAIEARVGVLKDVNGL